MVRRPDTAAAVRRVQFAMQKRARRFCLKFALEAYKRITIKTPVDTGHAKANWMVGVGKIDRSEVEEYATKGQSPYGMARAAESLATFRLGDIIYVTNSLPYIRVLEFGEYPNPPKRGSWVKGVGWVQKSEHGFSKQAPHGMVGVTLAEIQQIRAIALQAARSEELSSRLQALAAEQLGGE